MTDAVLSIRGLSVGYARRDLALEAVDLDVPRGGVVALLGANGAGKTTLIRAVSGLLKANGGHVAAEEAWMEGEPILRLPPHRRVARGMAQSPEGRLIFGKLTVGENLLVGAAELPRGERRAGLETIYEFFPALGERRRQAGGWLSGGEQQMLALGQVLIGRPRQRLVD